MSESIHEWSIVDITPAQAAPAPKPVRPSAHDALVTALSDWADEYDLPFDDGDLIVDIDSDGDLRLVLPHITVDEQGDIVTKQREYEWTATITIEVQVSGTVTANDEDHAHDLADEVCGGLELNSLDLDGYGFGGFEVDNYEVENYEVRRVREQ